MKHLKIKRYPLKLFLLIAIICSGPMYAKSQKVTKPAHEKKSVVKLPLAAKTPTAIIDTFFKKYKNAGSSAAIDFLFSTNKLFNNEAQIALLKSKLDSLQKSVGQYLDKELLAQKSAGNCLVFDSYLVKFMNQPIRFIFMFYRPQKEWELYRFKYDDQMDAELEEAGKINNNIKKP